MKQVRTWLNMIAVPGAPYPIPTSEVSYKAHVDLIDVALPINAGTLQADGTWAQHSGSSSDFAHDVLDLARANGQRYVPVGNPGHGAGIANLLVVLDDPALQTASANDLLSLATTRWDAPWHGFMYDGIDVPVAYLVKHQTFITLLSNTIRGAGMAFEFAQKGFTEGERFDLSDPAFVNGIADFYDLICYAYLLADPYSLQPALWQRECIEYALTGVPTAKLNLAFALYSRYWLTGEPLPVDAMITYSQVVQMVAGGGWTVEWVDGSGHIRESHSDTGAGDLWIADARSTRVRLNLATEYGLDGVMPFLPGWEDPLVWNAILEWKVGPRIPDRRRTSRKARRTDWREFVT